MIAAGEPQVYIPHGKLVLEQYENPTLRRTSMLDSTIESRDSYHLSAMSGGSQEEEEVYIHNNTVIWSRGYGDVYWELVKKFTCDGAVQQALWFEFDENPNRPACANVPASAENQSPGRKIPSLCIVEPSKVMVHTREGDEYACAVPYEIHRVWPTRFGLIIEKCPTSHPEIPNWFSLYHPLEEIVPVVLRDGADRDHVNFAKDKKLKFVFTGANPSIGVTFNEDTGLHAIWLIRKAEVDESLFLGATTDIKGPAPPTSHQSSFSGTFVPSNFASPSLSRSFALSQIHNASLQYQSPVNLPSIFNTTGKLTPKFDGETSRFYTPKASKSFAHHLNQPKLNGSPLRRVAPSRISAILARTPVPSPSASSLLFNELESPDDEEPLLPDLCLQILWTEDAKRSTAAPAVKCFVATDWLGKTCVCWLLDHEKLLRCIDIKVTENKSTGNPLYICCAQWSIPARDAEYIPALKALLVLDPTPSDSHSLTLYSGSTKLAKVHVPNCNPPGIGTGISLSMQRLSLEAGDRRSISGNKSFVPSTPLNSSRRSSLMHADLRDYNSVMLSPIPASAPSPTFRALQDPVGRQVTLKCSDRSLLRTLLPPLATSALVERALSSLRAALPPDAYLTVAAKFYCARNAPGPSDFSPPAEFGAFRSTLLTLLGFDGKTLDASLSYASTAASPVVETKKSRTNLEEGSEDDWLYLTRSPYAKSFAHPGVELPHSSDQPARILQVPVNNDSAHFGYLPHILLVLHLLYEDLKLDSLYWDDAKLLATLLISLASALNLNLYCDLYWRDFPSLWMKETTLNFGVINPPDLEKLMPMIQRIETPHNIHAHLLSIMSRRKISSPYAHVKQVNTRSRDIVVLFAILYGAQQEANLVPIHDYIRDFEWTEHSNRPHSPFTVQLTGQQSRQAAAVLKMSSSGWTLQDVDALPAGIGLPIRHALFHCQLEPPTDWPDEAYRLINRHDMCQRPTIPVQARNAVGTVTVPELNLKGEGLRHQGNKGSPGSGTSKDDFADDGMEEVMELPIWKLLFPRDHRIQEVRRLIGSARPVPVILPASQQQGLSEHELIEEREKQLLVLCIRVMALPVGRGMFTLHTSTPTVTETLSIPKLCLTGKTPHNGAAVDMTHIDVPPNMSLWPQFHNGVAAGLRVSPQTHYIDSNLINLNRNNSNRGQNASGSGMQGELTPELAGFLLGLGLTGHLNKFNDLIIHEHLNRDHEMTQLALILGLGIGKRGSMEADTLRIVSVYIEPLSPFSATLNGGGGCCGATIEVPQNVRVAALMSIGFLYQGSAHRYMTEVLLAEIDRPPGPEMDNCVDRESYSLAAGLALGMVTLGQGGQMAGLADLRLADTLYHFMVGGAKRSENTTFSSRTRSVPGVSSASYQIREGSTVNVDVTAPGAILALGLMFHRTNNAAVAQWMTAPDSQQLLDSIRPDFLLLRTLARGLILWDQVMPTREWVESNVPPNIRRYSLRNPGEPDSDGQSSQQIDYETMNQAFYNIMAGACLVLGFKFAGSANAEAFHTLHRYAKVLISLSGRSVAEWAGKATLEACLNVLLLSLSLVMVGTGDLQVLRLIRHLRSRSGSFSNVVTYGSHLATHMSLGFLYYGGGRLSLGTTPEAVAALVCACYPKFPTHSNDNRYHLQALRHLHVLAAQPRLLMPLEMPGMLPCYTNIQVVFNDEAGTFLLRAPCLLPELRFLQRVQLLDPRYRSVVFDRDHNWNKLERILAGDDHLIVQRKAGCLSYIEDPTGLASLATPTLSAWAIRAGTVANFTTDKFVRFLCGHFLDVPSSSTRSDRLLTPEATPLHTQLRLLSLVLNDCVVNEKTDLIKPWLQLLHKGSPSVRLRSTLPLWQLKFLFNSPVGPSTSSFIDPELVLALRHELESSWDNSVQQLRPRLHRYLSGRDVPVDRHPSMAELAVFYDLPQPRMDFADDPVSLLVQLDDPKLAARLAILLFL